jgi:hypothetical protein
MWTTWGDCVRTARANAAGARYSQGVRNFRTTCRLRLLKEQFERGAEAKAEAAEAIGLATGEAG